MSTARWHSHVPSPKNSTTSGSSTWMRRVVVEHCGRYGATPDADVVAYMDVDLSTDLNALMPLIAPFALRTLGTSPSVPGWHDRPAWCAAPSGEFISRSYNLILRSALHARFSDAQCGFKAMRVDVARQLLPLVEDTGWFFDTELLVLAERAGMRIHEVPVDWVDDPDSRVDIIATAVADLKGVVRVGRALSTGSLPLAELRASFGREPLVPGVPRGMVGQLSRFAVVGVISTLAYALLYLALHSIMGAQWANAVALLVTAVFNTAANRAFTFGIRGSEGSARHQMQGLLVFGFGLLLTSGSLFVLDVMAPDASKHVELAVLVIANLVATVSRFIALRWVFRTAQSVGANRWTATAETLAAPLPAPEPQRQVRWEPWALGVLLVGTGVAYIWGLGASGWANSFYAAAVQAGSVSWKAFFFGSSDAANSITVDKPPMSLWLMSLSVRIFGLNSWAMLVPQALLGVGSVALLWGTVRRYFGAAAGLLAGLVLALTPVAALMFRFNNPDALLVLLMIAAVWAMMRAVQDGRTRWLVLVGIFCGFGFLTKAITGHVGGSTAGAHLSDRRTAETG